MAWHRAQAQTGQSLLAGKPYTVYNLTVEDARTFFVGSAGGGTWVHNVNCLNELKNLKPDEKFNHYEPNPQGGPHTRLRFEEDGNTINSAQKYDAEGYAVRRTDFLSRSGRTDHEFSHYHQMQWSNGARNPGGSPTIGDAIIGLP